MAATTAEACSDISSHQRSPHFPLCTFSCKTNPFLKIYEPQRAQGKSATNGTPLVTPKRARHFCLPLTSASTPGPKNETYFSIRSGSTHLLNGVILDWNTIVNPSSPFGSTVWIKRRREREA